ncbi:MAG: fibronectin type III domain-containing protein [Arhodomonas sp.]|nr:fibronectin type III domain-containing protein [Arhodomonas sp.]
MMRKTLLGATIAPMLTAFALGPTSVFEAQSDDIKVNLERPEQARITTGINVIQGWTTAPAEIDRVELYINEEPDGSPDQVLAFGGSREAVCAAVSSPDCPNVGFASTYNYNLLENGQHEFTVRAYDTNGDHNDDSARFTVKTLGEEFIDDRDRISLPAFQVSNVFKENSGSSDQRYDVEFEWSTAAQAFVMTDLAEKPNNILFISASAPTGLTATKASGNVELEWTDNTGPDDFGQENWFVVERKFSILPGGGEYRVIGVTRADATEFVDDDVVLTVGTGSLAGTYTYRVSAAVPSGTSASGEVVVNQTQDSLVDDPDLLPSPDLDL